MIHQSDELLRVHGFLEVKIEAEIEVTSRNRSGFQLGDVDSAGIDSGQHLVKGTRRVLRGAHEAGLICARIDFQGFGDTDKTRVVVIAVLHRPFQAF